MNAEARHQLDLLEALSENAHTTQRGLSSRVGIALGLTNIYLKRLVHKGYVKCVNAKSNRLMYLVTASGLAEKTRLTYEFMEYSLRLYRNARGRVREVLQPIVLQQHVRVALYGRGEAAELAFLCLKELGVEPIAVFNDDAAASFFNVPVHRLVDHPSVQFDLLIVATFEAPTLVLNTLLASGISAHKLVPLR
jgi:DNA-binding Lrp family transcriptional regulator